MGLRAGRRGNLRLGGVREGTPGGTRGEVKGTRREIGDETGQRRMDVNGSKGNPRWPAFSLSEKPTEGTPTHPARTRATPSLADAHRGRSWLVLTVQVGVSFQLRTRFLPKFWQKRAPLRKNWRPVPL